MNYKAPFWAGLLVCCNTTVSALPVDDITRRAHLDGLTDYMESLDAQSYVRQLTKENTPPPSLDIVAERSEVLPTALGNAMSQWSARMDEEVKYGLGLRQRETESPSTYIQEWGTDKIAVDAGALLNTLTIEGGNNDSIVRLIRNMTNPFPAGGNGLSPEEQEELERQLEETGNSLPENRTDDREKEAHKFVTQAALSSAQNSLLGIYSRRLPDGQSPSLMQVMDTEALYRIQDGDWHVTISTAPAEALLRELVHMTAYQIWMQQQQFLQNERIEALLASSISLQSQMTDAVRETQQMSQGQSTYSPQQAGALD